MCPHIDGFASKPHNLIFFLNQILLMVEIDMITLHNVSKFQTNRSIRSLLKIQFVNIKYIKLKRYFDQCLSLLTIQESKVYVVFFLTRCRCYALSMTTYPNG